MATLYCYYRLYSSANGQRLLTHLFVPINCECELSTKRISYLIHESRQKVCEAMESLIMRQTLRAANALCCSEKHYVSDHSLRVADEVDIKLIIASSLGGLVSWTRGTSHGVLSRFTFPAHYGFPFHATVFSAVDVQDTQTE